MQQIRAKQPQMMYDFLYEPMKLNFVLTNSLFMKKPVVNERLVQ